MLGLLIASATMLTPVSTPDPKLTPGVMVSPNVTVEVICAPGYSANARKSLSSITKRLVWEAYGIPKGERYKYRLDHLFPIEAGGCASCERNLWPEPVEDSKKKDRLENKLHKDLCSGKIQLSDVPRLINQGW